MTSTDSNRQNHTGRIAKSAGAISAAVFLSRILGLVREQVMAGLFGAGTAMDAFVVAFRIPNLLRDLFAEGALSSAFVTVLSDYETKRSREETWLLVNNVLATLTVIISLVTLCGIYFSKELVLLLAPDFAEIPGKVALSGRLTVIMFPFLLLISISSLAMGILNTRGKFFIPAMASSCFNMGSILVGGGLALLFPSYGRPAIEGMAIGTLAGGAMQLIIQLPLVFRFGFRLRPRIKLSDPGLRRIGRLIVPAVIGLSATQINIFVNTNFASRCAEGSVAWLNYAFRLIQFPIGLFGVALSMAALPVIARQAAKGDRSLMGETFVSALNMVFVLTIPAAAGLAVLADPLVALIFEHGHFNLFDTAMTATAVRFYAIGLMAYSAVKVTVPVFYALDDTRWPVIASFAAVAANIIIILLTLERFQHRAIALSTSLTMIMNFFLLTFVLYQKTGGYPVARLLSTFMRAMVASCIMAAGVWYICHILDNGRGIAALGLQVGVSVAAGVIIYLLMVWLLRIKEVEEVMSAVLSKMNFKVKEQNRK